MQNLKNLSAAIIVQDALPITTASATTNGTTIDTSLLPQAGDGTFIVKASALGGGTVTFKVQESADNFTTPVDVAGTSVVAVAGTPVAISLVRESRARYLRVVATLAGATNATFSAVFVSYALKTQPKAGTTPIVIG